MRTKILTLRFSPQVGGFDEGPLLALQQKVVLTQLREHLVQVGGEAMLVCVAEWRERAEPLASGADATNPYAGNAAIRRQALPAAPSAMPAARPAVTPVATARIAHDEAIESPATDDVRPPEPAPAPAGHCAPATPVGELRANFTAEQQVVFDLLRKWRRQRAYAEGAPPYVILTNRQLVELVQQRPRTKAALGQIAGFGEKKLARHGADLLALLWPEAPPRAEPDGEIANGNAAEPAREVTQ